MDIATVHHAVLMAHTMRHSLVQGPARPHVRGPFGRARESLTTEAQQDAVDCAIWGGAVVPLLFLIQYTFFSGGLKWWRTAAGRAIVALDICLMAVFIPSAFVLADPSIALGAWHQWLVVVALLCVPLIVLYRMCSIEYGRRLRKHGIKGDKYAQGDCGDKLWLSPFP